MWRLYASMLSIFLVLSSLSPNTVVTGAAASDDPASNLANFLFPSEYTYENGFTTASGISVPGINTVALADKTLNVVKVAANMTHNVVQQSGKTAWEAFYPQGTNSFKSAIQAGAKEVVLGYSVMFQDGWQWVRGGKVPGGFGGIGDSAFGCDGGRQEDRIKCFNLRLMWRANGLGELYAYLPIIDQNTQQLLAVPPRSINNPDFGVSAGRGAFTFPAGQWVTVAERIKLNDLGTFDGEITIWFNGTKVIDVSGLMLRDSLDSVIQGTHFSTFFGGSTVDWATPVDQRAWFADVSGAIITGQIAD